ncbi:MAG: hypothetical protein RLN90_01465 [Balneolaceae bacterium]
MNNKEYKQLEDDVIQLHLYYKVYEELFLSKSNIKVLNQSAPYFFFTFQNLLIGKLIIEISKLTDPHIQGKNKNLSLGFLLERTEDEDLKKELRSLLSEINEKVEHLRNHRSKFDAHRDLKIAIGQMELEPFSILQIKDILNLIKNYMETFLGPTRAWTPIVGNNTQALVATLQNGLF